jgi:hypothetical protein
MFKGNPGTWLDRKDEGGKPGAELGKGYWGQNSRVAKPTTPTSAGATGATGADGVAGGILWIDDPGKSSSSGATGGFGDVKLIDLFAQTEIGRTVLSMFMDKDGNPSPEMAKYLKSNGIEETDSPATSEDIDASFTPEQKAAQEKNIKKLNDMGSKTEKPDYALVTSPTDYVYSPDSLKMSWDTIKKGLDNSGASSKMNFDQWNLVGIRNQYEGEKYSNVFKDGKLNFKDFLKFAACHKKGKYYSPQVKRCVSKQQYKIDKILFEKLGKDAGTDYNWWNTTPESGGLTSKAAADVFNRKLATRIKDHYFPGVLYEYKLPAYARRLDRRPLKYIAKVRAILNECDKKNQPIKDPETDKYYKLETLVNKCNNISINERAYYKERNQDRADFVKQEEPNVNTWSKFFTTTRQGETDVTNPYTEAEDFGTSMFGKRRRYRRKSRKSKKSKKGKKGHKKPPAALVKRARKYGVKISKKVGKKRVYKSVSVIKRQIKKKMTKLRRAARRKH